MNPKTCVFCIVVTVGATGCDLVNAGGLFLTPPPERYLAELEQGPFDGKEEALLQVEIPSTLRVSLASEEVNGEVFDASLFFEGEVSINGFDGSIYGPQEIIVAGVEEVDGLLTLEDDFPYGDGDDLVHLVVVGERRVDGLFVRAHVGTSLTPAIGEILLPPYDREFDTGLDTGF